MGFISVCHATRAPVKTVQKHSNFGTFCSLSVIRMDCYLSFLPTDYETWLYKLFMELGLNPIIEIFRSGFFDFILTVKLRNRL